MSEQRLIFLTVIQTILIFIIVLKIPKNASGLESFAIEESGSPMQAEQFLDQLIVGLIFVIIVLYLVP